MDNSKAKQNKLLPGSHIEIVSPEKLEELKLDYLIIFPWNLLNEIKSQNKSIYDNGLTKKRILNQWCAVEAAIKWDHGKIAKYIKHSQYYEKNS